MTAERTAEPEYVGNMRTEITRLRLENTRLRAQYEELAHAVHNQNLEADGQTLAGLVLKNQALRAEVERLTDNIATRQEHDDLAPHENCACRLCDLLLQLLSSYRG